MDILFAVGFLLIPLILFFLVWHAMQVGKEMQQLDDKQHQEEQRVREPVVPSEAVTRQRNPTQTELPFSEEGKHCPKCQRTLPFSSFSRNKNTTDGLTKWCTECLHKPHQQQAHLKHCPKCGRNRRRSSFYKSNKNPDGLTKWCKSCLQEYRRGQRK